MSGDFPPEVEQIFLADFQPASKSNRESVKILVIGSRQSVNKTVHHLHQLRFAEFNEWSRLLPAPVPGEVMRILVRDVVVENP